MEVNPINTGHFKFKIFNKSKFKSGLLPKLTNVLLN